MHPKKLARLYLTCGFAVGLVPTAGATPAGQDKITEVVVREGTAMAIALSPDRSTVVMDLQGVLFTMPIRGGAARAVTDTLYNAHQPCWYGDGSRIAFQSNRDGHWRIWSIKPDGSDPKILTPGPFEAREPACSPDGSSIAFSSERSGNYDIWELALDSGVLHQRTHAASDEMRASYSPDGKDIAYTSERESGSGIYATASDGVERLVANAEIRPGNITAPLGTPVWTPDGKDVVYALITGGTAKLMRGNTVISANEDVHPFRGAWLSADEYLYTANGKIKHRSLSTGVSKTLEFSAKLPVRRAEYARHVQDLASVAVEPVLGLLKPVLSPDGKRVAFAALGKLWLMEIGGKPRALTSDGPYVVTDPAWSSDGSKLVYSSDRSGSMDLWIYELAHDKQRRITNAPGAETRPAWSPDGKRIAFVTAMQDFFGQVQVLDLANAKVVTVQPSSFGPGYPSWSADGQSIMISRMEEYSKSKSYEAGATNQIQVLSADGLGKPRDHTVVAHHSIGTRSAADGPIWSPDGRSIAFAMDQALWTMQVTPEGMPVGVPRKLKDGLASFISWSGDSSQLLYVDVDELKLAQVASGQVRTVPLDLTWQRQMPAGTLVIHAGTMVDGIHRQARSNVDIVVEGNRIVAIEPHKPGRRADRFIDASRYTVMPGLIDSHVHFSKDFGSSFGKLLLAYGFTTVRSPGSIPADAIEEREAQAAGVRPSPRVFTTGYILEGERAFWDFSTPVANIAQADREIERARKLKYDMLKTYIHNSEPVRRHLIEEAHKLGIPVSSHEIYPAAQFGSDSVEHFDSSASDRGYSLKASAMHNVYDDVVQILAKSDMTVTPTMALLVPMNELVTEADRKDPRWAAQPIWAREAASAAVKPSLPIEVRENILKGILKLHRAGVRLIAGTDAPLTPVGLATHKELELAVKAGMTPFEALQMATIVPAGLLGESEAIGSIEVGKLADMVVLDGNPLVDIRNARNVREILVNGTVYGQEELPLK